MIKGIIYIIYLDILLLTLFNKKEINLEKVNSIYTYK